MSPKVSLVMAVYNGERFLKESIESILAQSFKDFEFIIIDDGSIDATPSILHAYSSIDPRVKIISNEKNIGLTRSLNKGIGVCSGAYIARMDAGDTSEPERFTRQVLFLDNNKNCGLVGTWGYVIDEDNKKIGEMKYPTDDRSLKKDLIKYNPFVHSSIMVRANILKQVGFYNENWIYAQDYELYFRISRCSEVANIADHLVSYRVYSKSITNTKNKKQTLFALKARLTAIKNGQYSPLSFVYFIKPLIGYLLPYSIKKSLKNILNI